MYYFQTSSERLKEETLMFAWLAAVPWYVWVIVALAAGLVGVVYLLYAAVRGTGDALVGIWLKGNFPKR